jgi:deoxyribodipyrimidine photolyase-related protein
MNLIILPNQLFPLKLIENMKDINTIYLIEEPRYFTDFKFHKLKIMYHRASMKKYESLIKGKTVKYIDFKDVNSELYKKLNNDKTYYFNPIDHNLFDKFNKKLNKATMMDNINFLLTPKEIEENKDVFYKNKKYSHDSFYKFQRERLDILMKNNKPIGNKWSFDTENRKALPKGIKIPKVPKVTKDKYYKEALTYVEKHFPKNYGAVSEWNFPIDTKGAIKWLKNFITKRLPQFGPYEDAVDTENPFLFHSVLSPMMNIGILPDICVVKITNDYYEKNKSKIPIASFEGFIRQVIGWRNYVYSIYMLEPDMYNNNFLKCHNKIDERYWLGTTTIKPIDTIINNIVKYSYAHHIERLMYLGNWFLINQIDPKEVHRIFMEWTVDAYDWVMVPNIMGMSQYADGGKMMTRIYFSSSNYIDKMSTFKRKSNEEWWKIWDAIYYSFINKNLKLLQSNYATARQVKHWKDKSASDKENLLKIANKYMNYKNL